jgi:hypothetical protein
MSNPMPQLPLNPSDPGKVLTFVEELIQYYGDGAQKYGKRLFRLKAFGIASSVLVTVLSGISAVAKPYPWVVTVVAGLSTFLTGLLTTTKTQEYYVIASGQQGKLEGELLLYYGSGGPYAAEPTEAARVRLFVERTHQIYAEGRQAWERANKSAEGS